jgi:L-cystine uptake protein TcyP (sodium:dicarboxylate symporter family)
MNKIFFVWLMIVGILGAAGTAPVGGAFDRATLVFLAWLGLALLGFLVLIGVVVV